jgi:RNA polymerase subunit RPABC4/transcription elongation factor Spt4
MSKKKVCKNCKIFVEEDVCPLCKGTNFSTSWQGRVFILDSSKSDIAKKMGFNAPGEYAIKVK